jgi:hypothetical protein
LDFNKKLPLQLMTASDFYVSARLITVQFSKIKQQLVVKLLNVLRIAAATAILI